MKKFSRGNGTIMLIRWRNSLQGLGPLCSVDEEIPSMMEKKAYERKASIFGCTVVNCGPGDTATVICFPSTWLRYFCFSSSHANCCGPYEIQATHQWQNTEKVRINKVSYITSPPTPLQYEVKGLTKFRHSSKMTGVKHLRLDMELHANALQRSETS